MMWKAIGESVIGTSHTAADKDCEDAVQFIVAKDINGDDVMIGCASDGAGSAQFGGQAAAFTTQYVTATLEAIAEVSAEINEQDIFAIVEAVYDELAGEAEQQQVTLNEYSCTLLGCYITKTRAVFFQIGDGAIVRSDGSGYYTYVWWPHNGEYQNATVFLVDDRSFGDLKVMVVDEPIDEVAMFTDGLQMLALNTETQQVHQPFFTGLFPQLRMADDESKIEILNRKLAEYLDGKAINDRTDDDKTLLLATRLAP